MDRKQHITAFYLETLLMITVFISIILVMTRVFGSARVQSAGAERLTASVTLAQNMAEAVSASAAPEELLALVDQGGNAELRVDQNTGHTIICAAYDKNLKPVKLESGAPAAAGALFVEAEWITPGQEDGLQGGAAAGDTAGTSGLADCRIQVSDSATGTQIYSLETAVYVPER